MDEFDDAVVRCFLKKQRQLFPENVAETPEEAEDFLDMCMAAVCKNMKEVREYFDETGADISGMSKEELENKIATFTGGRVAEDLVFHSITTGASNDIEQATKLARGMITRYGMSEKFGMERWKR